MTQLTAPIRFDLVGSFLRPCYLEKARADARAGAIAPEELTRIENQAIRNLVLRQKELGLSVITDGGFRQGGGPLDFMLGFAGVDRTPSGEGLCLTGRLSAHNHPAVDHFRFLKGLEGGQAMARLTIPAPAQFLLQLVLPAALPQTRQIYPHRAALLDDLAQSYRQVMADLYDAGCRSLQLDDAAWCFLADPQAQQLLGVDEAGLEELWEQCLTENDLALADRPRDLTVTARIRRDGPTARWTYCGSGAERLFRRSKADVLHLAFAADDSFAPLRAIPADKQVALGLLSTGGQLWEDKAHLAACIHQAARHIPLERLSLSPQGGFSAHPADHRLTEREQWAKLALGKEIAAAVW